MAIDKRPLRRISAILLISARLGGGLAALALAGCGACPPGQCDPAVTFGPVDGAMVPGALEATARQFLGGSGTAPGSSGAAGGVLARLPLRRDTLSPGSGTAYRVTTSQSLGLRLERHWPVTARTRGFVALQGGAGQQRYFLPQGLGPLTDPMQIGFLTGWVGTEIGLRHERILTTHPDTALRLSVSAGHDLTLTRTHLQSALVDVTNRHHEGRRHASLGLGLVWRPAGTGAEIEWQGAARVLQGGQRLFRSEWRLSH